MTDPAVVDSARREKSHSRSKWCFPAQRKASKSSLEAARFPTEKISQLGAHNQQTPNTQPMTNDRFLIPGIQVM